MTLDTFLHLVDRVGAPMAVLMGLVFVLVALIKGPGMKVAEIVGATLADLIKTRVSQLATGAQVEQATTTVTAAVEREAADMKATVEREHATTRAHVTDVVQDLRDRLAVAPPAPPPPRARLDTLPSIPSAPAEPAVR